ncbi:efflux RND transporter periplasmic adaptor subunit [Lichenibacterium ramalinae]|uniref:Efflux RND transporter periplasmic adaptor subunit n=1 Tax=Lichenibacterium ramalinae TaxID=2316527 RepID=A0A4Q2RJP2_9HYPH|nr:HlyD family secretion protein [Lichenibacterium ramalinae]RYB07201.1 efflux RND transporter periplasmic adaptor subunit [Lichenibacterium ramalinae]
MSEASARAPSREEDRPDPQRRSEPTGRQPAPERSPPPGRDGSAGQAPRPDGVRRRARRGWRILPVLVTLCIAAVAAYAGWLLWNAYMASPWTRDGTVRVYVVTVAPEVSGQIVDLPVRDNQFVHKGDLLMRIDPRDYRVAIDLSQAALDQAQADYMNKQSQAARRLQLTDLATTPEQKEQYVSAAKMAQADVEQQKANLDRAKINMERTEIRAPVNGWVTNLLTQQGNYATTGQTALSVVDSDSYWVDGYFEETNIGPIREGDPAKVYLLGYRRVVLGHVDSVARAIVVSNAQPGQSGLATVNPIFTWVRLAQRVPVRVHLDDVPPDVRLVAGMTATVEVDPPAGPRPPVADTGAQPGSGAPQTGPDGQPAAPRSAAPQSAITFTAPIAAAGGPTGDTRPAEAPQPPARAKP